MTNAARSAWEVAADLLFPEPNPYLKDPVGWVRDVLGEDLWSGQEWIMRSVVDNRRIVVKAGHSVGKTRVISRLIAWFVSVHPINDVRVVVTADNFDQITGGIWRELIMLHQERADLARTTGRPELALPGKSPTLDAKWHAGAGGNIEVAVGSKPADGNPTGIQGRHARHLLCIVEEACGVPEALWEAVDSLASNEGATVLAVGNPTDPAAYMATVCKPGSGWLVKKIASTDAPEFTGEVVSESLAGVLASKEWVEAKRKLWGENSPSYVARILGEFPDISDDTLIQPKWIREAQERDLPRTLRPCLGADIARYGSDKTVIYRNEGGHIRMFAEYVQADTMTTAGHIMKARNDIHNERQLKDWPKFVIDVIGVGAGVYDRVREQNLEAVGFSGSAAPIDKERFANARAECYWMLREMFERGEVDIDPRDDILAAQLGSIKWKISSSGKIIIESKDDMKARGMPSPDHADAFMYSTVSRAGQAINMESHVSTPGLSSGVMEEQW